MVRQSISGPAPTSRQRRELGYAREAMGGGSEVRAFATGRASARWSKSTSRIVGIFGGAMVLFLVYFHAILIPGFLVAYLIYDSAKPRRGVAVTTSGVTELKLRVLNGRPDSVLTATGHEVLYARVREHKGRYLVRLGGEEVSLRETDLWRLREMADAVSYPSAEGDPSLPPPPVGDLAGAESEWRALPRWREATILWALVHLGIGLAWFVGVFIAANVVSSALGRDVEHTSSGADIYLWTTFVGAIAAWMLFVYWRGTFRRRLFILGLVLGATLLICCVANTVYSPPGIH
jgi:hypothetical protein